MTNHNIRIQRDPETKQPSTRSDTSVEAGAGVSGLQTSRQQPRQEERGLQCNKNNHKDQQPKKPKQQQNTTKEGQPLMKNGRGTAPRSLNPLVAGIIFNILEGESFVSDGPSKMLFESMDSAILIPKDDVVALGPN